MDLFEITLFSLLLSGGQIVTGVIGVAVIDIVKMFIDTNKITYAYTTLRYA